MRAEEVRVAVVFVGFGFFFVFVFLLVCFFNIHAWLFDTTSDSGFSITANKTDV